jgi:uncharacterized protein
LLQGFRYGEAPLQRFSSAEQAQFHLANLRWVLLSEAPIAQAAIAEVVPNTNITLAQFDEAIKTQITSWLAALACAPSALLQAMHTPHDEAPLRLGRYAEKLLGFFLQQAGCFTLIAQHVSIRRTDIDERESDPARRDHTTIGELDFLLVDAQQRALHWEFAIKFFLAEPYKLALQLSDFIGPDRKNSLQLKLERMLLRQLQQRAPAPYAHQHWLPQAFSRGYLFYPRAATAFDPRTARAPGCSALNPLHGRGSWIGAEAIAELPDATYLPLPRWRWLAAAQACAHDQLLSRNMLAAALAAHWQQDAQRAVLLARLDQDGLECERIFVRSS